jgi:hypothetical protein
MKVIIKGIAGEHNAKDVNTLNGINWQEDFVEYFDGDSLDKLISGYMRFEVVDGSLWTITEYEINAALTDEELTELANYTQGQWSDGIGEGFEQFSCCEEDGNEIFVSPWYPGQVLEIDQQLDLEYVLLQASVCFGDEFNCEMFAVRRAADWIEYKNEAKAAFEKRGEDDEPIEIYFGTNECFQVSSYEEWDSDIRETLIGEAELEVLKKLFSFSKFTGKLHDFGTGSRYFNILEYLE